MRMLIVSDMEGVSSIVVWEQVSGGVAAPELPPFIAGTRD